MSDSKPTDSKDDMGHVPGEDPSRLDSARLLQFVQILVFVVSGCWALYQFLTFTSHSQKLQLEKEKLEIDYKRISQKLADLELNKSKQDYQLKKVELTYSEKLAILELQRIKQDAILRNIELKYADSKQNMEFQKAVADNTSKEHELRKEIATIYDRIVELSNNFIQLKAVYAEKKTQDSYKNMQILKAVLDLQKDNFINLEAKLAKLEKREVRKIPLEFDLPAPPQNLRATIIR